MPATKVRRPLAQILPIAERLRESLEHVCERIAIAGSVRRKKPEVGDVEIVAVSKIVTMTRAETADIFGNAQHMEEPFDLLWARLDDWCPKECRLKWGKKYRQFMFEGVQIDLFTSVPDGWGWALLVRTGSAEFSHSVAATLNRCGYTSKDFRIYRGRTGGQIEGDPIPTPEERDVFRLAGLDYLEPERRM
jgi:DNA polymerase/3'-5' exonuclease PolX